MKCETCNNEADPASNEYGYCLSCWNIAVVWLLKAVAGHRCQTCNTRRVDRNGQQCWACIIFVAGRSSGLFTPVVPDYGKIAEVFGVLRALKYIGVEHKDRGVYIGGKWYTEWPEDLEVETKA